jgi:hypothetical protein
MLVNQSINIGLLRSLTPLETAGISKKKVFVGHRGARGDRPFICRRQSHGASCTSETEFAATSRARRPKTPPKPKIDYTNFSHTTHVVSETRMQFLP